MWKTILNLLFPIKCLGCGQEGNFVCLNCFKNIPLNTLEPENNLLVSSYYTNPLVKQMILRYKYDFIKELAEPLGLLMIEKLKSYSNILKNNPVLIPIPLHEKRLRWRGFNQAELLADEIGRKMDIPVVNNILIKSKNTPAQAKISNPLIRKENMNQAFALPETKVVKTRFSFYRPDLGLSDKTIILVDDIATTGATLKQAVQALQPLQARRIYMLVVAKG